MVLDTTGFWRMHHTLMLPPYTDPNSKALWKPVYEELLKRMQRRGLDKAVMLGFMSDAVPTKEESEFFKIVAGADVPWICQCHLGVPPSGKLRYDQKVIDAGYMNLGYQASVCMVRFPRDLAGGATGMLGWKRPDLAAVQDRYLPNQPPSRWRLVEELNITGNQRGVGRGGADFWGLKDRRGNRSSNACNRYPHSSWRNTNIVWSLLAPGPKGPIATCQYEFFREGLQECEARILLESAVTDEAQKGRLGADLARRCQDLLLERTYDALKGSCSLQLKGYDFAMGADSGSFHRQPGTGGHYWFAGSGWQEKSRKLYSLAGEVAARLAQK